MVDIVFAGFGIVGGLLVIASIIAAYKVIARREPDPQQFPSDYGLDYQEIVFQSRDGIPLQGWWMPSPNNTRPVIIQCHGQNGSMDPDLVQAKMLYEGGFSVLMFNFRAHGMSGGKFVTFGIRETDDLSGALDYVHSTYSLTKIGVIGFSMGANTALRTASHTNQIASLIVDGVTGNIQITLGNWLIEKGIPPIVARPFVGFVLGIASLISQTNLYQVKPADWIPKIKGCPIFFIHAAQDEFIARQTLEHMVQSAEVETKLWIVPTTRHREGQASFPLDYALHITQWFHKTLS